MRLLLSCAFVAFFAIHAVASDPFPISQDIKGDDRFPSVAVNKSGDLYIVWSREFTGRAVLYGSYCRKQADGSFDIGPAKALTGAGGFIQEPQVAYSAKSNSFLVLWVYRNPDEVTNGRDIVIRRISSKGKPLGSVRTLVGGPAADRKAILAPMPDGRFAVAWERLILNEHARFEHAGLYTMILAPDGRVDEKERAVFLPDLDSRDVFDAVWPEDVTVRVDGSILIAGSRYIFEDVPAGKVPFGYLHAFLLSLDSKREFESLTTRLELHSCDARVAMLSGKNAMFAFNIQSISRQDGFAQAYRVDKKIKRRSSVANYDVEFTYITPDFVPLPDGGALMVYVREKEELLALRIDANGNFVSDPVTLAVQPGFNIRDIQAQLLQDQESVLVTFSDIAELDGKLWGMVVKLEE